MSGLIEGQAIRIALIGAGKIARDAHLPSLDRSNLFHCVASVDPAQPLADLPGFASLKDLLASGINIDAVAICTPPEPRANIAREALEAGLHVMLEKPPGVSSGEVASLQAVANKNGCALFAAWHSREASAVDAARQWLVGKTVRSVEIAWCEDIREWHPGQDWLLASSGFGAFDPGINALSIATSILPLPLSVRSATLFIPEGRGAPLRVEMSMNLRGEAPVRAEFDISGSKPARSMINIVTDSGAMELRDGGARARADGALLQARSGDEYSRLYDRFHDLIRRREIDLDLRPLKLVEGAVAIGQRSQISAFSFE